MAGSLYVDNIGGGTPDASAAAQIDSTTGGFLLPRQTTTQRDAIATPAEGLTLYNTTTDTIDVYINGAWVSVASGATAPTFTGNITITKADPTIIFNTVTATDTDFWLGVQEDAGGDNDDSLQIGTGTTPGTGAVLTLTQAGSLSVTALDSTPIGATTPSTGAFTTLAATNTSTASFFALTGDGVGVNNRNDAYLNTAGTAPTLQTRRARGSLASPSDVQASDRLGQWTAAGYASGAFAVGFALIVSVPSGATIAANSVPSQVTFEAIRANGETSRAEYIGLKGTTLVLNDDGVDIDFRVESDGNANMFVVDAGTDRVGIGKSSPATVLDVLLTDSGTNAVVNVLTVGHNGGTPTTNFGTGIVLQGESSTTNAQDMARWRTYWNVATHASRAAYAVLSAYDTAERDAIGIGASGTAPLVGFYNLATAPVAQYATTGTTTGFTAGSGSAAKDDSTFTGNTGSTAYTIGDIVRALKLIGLIAA